MILLKDALPILEFAVPLDSVHQDTDMKFNLYG